MSKKTINFTDQEEERLEKLKKLFNYKTSSKMIKLAVNKVYMDNFE